MPDYILTDMHLLLITECNLTRCWSGFGMLLFGKTQQKHPGSPIYGTRPVPSTPDLSKASIFVIYTYFNIQKILFYKNWIKTHHKSIKNANCHRFVTQYANTPY